MPASKRLLLTPALLCPTLLLSHPAPANDACCADKPDPAFAALTGDWVMASPALLSRPNNSAVTQLAAIFASWPFATAS